MYVKPPHRQIHGVYVPENYNGTTFTEPASEPAQSESPPPMQESESPAEKESVPTGKSEDKGLFSSLFSGLGGLRSDDILLLGLILLLSRSDGMQGQHSTSEILPLLALLLFLG